jgi:hypothetical protein
MRPALVLLGVLLVGLSAGCGDDGGATTLPTAVTTTTFSPTTLPPPDCPAPVAISSTGDLLAVLAGMDWAGSGAYSSGLQPITPDLVVTGTVVLEAAAIPLPAECLERSDCSHQGGFFGGALPAGATLQGEADLTCLTAASRLTLANTTVRLRTVLVDTHPCAVNFVPVVEVEAPCGTPCGPGLALCPGDGVCYAQGDSFCRRCEGGGREECACRGADGPLPEGAHCTYWQSGDVRCDGTCRQGTCATACD